MEIRKKMKPRRSNALAFSGSVDSSRDALADQVVDKVINGRSIDSIARSMRVTPQMVERILRERLNDSMELLDDLKFQRNFQLLKLRALGDSRMEAALDGDNIAFNQMMKVIPLENGLLGLDDKKSIQEIVLKGMDGNVNNTYINIASSEAEKLLDKYTSEPEATELPENTHTSSRNMGELFGQSPETQDIVDAEIVDEDEDKE